MSQAIFKYGLCFTLDRQTVMLPKVYQILRFEFQLGHPFIWAITPINSPCVERVTLRILGTGQELEEGYKMSYVNTAFAKSGVWHLFKVDDE